jgi:predicted transcriptional regulator
LVVSKQRNNLAFKMPKITPKEYAAMQGITLQAVTKALREGRKLEHVLKVEKFGRFYLLTIKAKP